MPQIQVLSKRFNYLSVKDFGRRLLVAVGLAQADAELVADSLVESNLRGIDSHGIARLPHYLRRIEAGSIWARPNIRSDKLAPATCLVDGDHGLGQLVMWRAAGESVQTARSEGAGWAAVCHSSHCGALSYFGLRIAEAGMIGLVFTHVDPMVVPYGSAEPFCGTNPICITAPGEGDKTLCLDMATSVTPWNTIQNAAMEGVAIPQGWAVDADGHATADPTKAAAVFPAGEYKGSGLGMLIDVLCAMLGGAPYGPDIPRMYGDLSQQRRLGGLVGAIDITRFVPLDTFRRRVSEMIERWGSLRPVEPDGRVLYPGEREVACRRERLANGLPLGLQLVDEFNGLARHYRVPPLEDRDAGQQMRVDGAGSVEPPAGQIRPAATPRSRPGQEAGKPSQ